MNKRLLGFIALLMCCMMFLCIGCSKAQSGEEGTTQASKEVSIEPETEAKADNQTNTNANASKENVTNNSSENATEPSGESQTETKEDMQTEGTEGVTTGAVEDSSAVETELSTVAKEETSTKAPSEITAGSGIRAILADLQSAKVVSSNPGKVTSKPVVSGANVAIEKVQTFRDSFVVVTLNAKLDKVDASDITLKKYTDDWYSLSPSSSTMTVKDSYATVNDEGKTVIIYQVSDKINGTKAVTDTSGKKFSNLSAEVTKANNYVSWQMDHGGWDKGVEEQAKTAWNGKDKKNKFSGWTAKNGSMLGTIDNDATYTQMRHIAAVYREVKDVKYKESVLKGLDFIFKLQYESGGFAQVYPRRGNYSDNVTFNDDAMINVLIMLQDMANRAYPFDSDIIPDDYMTKIDKSIDKAIDYILKAQIKSNGKLTAWCAQHDPVTYAPVNARAYELASISGSESVSIVKFLMNQEQTPKIKAAVESAIQWFKDSEAKGIKYVKNDPNGVYFVKDANSSLWYRFYDIATNRPIFCDRDGVKKYSITEISEERRNGYSWSGTYPKKLLEVYDKYGYYAGRIEVSVVKTNSATSDDKKLAKGTVKAVENEI